MFATKISLPMRHFMLALVAAFLVLASPTSAVAANGPWESVDLTLVNVQGGAPVLLVAGKLSPSATLPAKVALAIPKNSKVAWAGEILGGDPAKDPIVQYTVKPGKDYDLVEFTLAKVRIGQVEVSLPGAVSISGGATQATIDWVAPFDIPSANLAIELPSGAQVASATPDATTTAGGAGSFSMRTVRGVSEGDSLKLTVAYTATTTGGGAPTSAIQPPPNGASGTAPRGGASPLLIISVLGLLISLTVALMKWVSPRGKASDETDDEESDESENEEPEETAATDSGAVNDADPAHECGPGCACGAQEAVPSVKKRKPSTKSGTSTEQPSTKSGASAKRPSAKSGASAKRPSATKKKRAE